MFLIAWTDAASQKHWQAVNSRDEADEFVHTLVESTTVLEEEILIAEVEEPLNTDAEYAEIVCSRRNNSCVNVYRGSSHD